MTLGDSQPLLTRRQAREAAQALEQEAVPADRTLRDGEPAGEAPAGRPEAADEPGAGTIEDEVPTGRKMRSEKKRRAAGTKNNKVSDSSEQAATMIATQSSTSEPSSLPSPTGTSDDPRSMVLPAVAPFSAHTADAKPSLATSPDSVPSRVLTRRELRARSAAAVEDVEDVSEPESEQEQATPVRPDVSENATLNPPVGHWSIDQGDADDVVVQPLKPLQSLDDLVNLGVGAGGIPTTTNALILPSIPNQGSTSGPFSNTGEILITGSFDLPRSLGETGQHPNHFDSSDIDQIMDQSGEFVQGENAPVSASRAISSHASTRGVMTPPKQRGLSVPVVLVVSTAAVAVSVSALLVVGHLLQIY